MSNDDEITVMYFGAGRGPLIRRALKAAEKTEKFETLAGAASFT